MFMQLYILYNGCCRDDAPLHGAKGSCVTLKETNRSRAVLAVFFPDDGSVSLRIYPSKPPSVAEVKVRNIVPSGLM